MTTFKQFTYLECLPPESLIILPDYLHIIPTQSAEVLLLRLLTGTIDIQNTTFDVLIPQRTNYSIHDYLTNTCIDENTILQVFTESDISIDNVKTYYLNIHTFGNRRLFENLLLELSNYFYQKNSSSYALGFLHLYRAIELVSYCFPLYYTSKAKSYEKTYVTLKDFFGKVEGELNFFKKFVNEHLFKDNQTFLDIRLPINIVAPGVELQEQYYNAFKKICTLGKITLNSAIPFTEIVISRRDLPSLIYSLRNRYFHLLSGDYNDNFSSSELAEINSFYENINDTILNWLTIIYIEILVTTIEPEY